MTSSRSRCCKVCTPKGPHGYKLKKTSWVTEVSIKATRVTNPRTTSLAPLLFASICIFVWTVTTPKQVQPAGYLVITHTHTDLRLCPFTDIMKCWSQIQVWASWRTYRLQCIPSAFALYLCSEVGCLGSRVAGYVAFRSTAAAGECFSLWKLPLSVKYSLGLWWYLSL